MELYSDGPLELTSHGRAAQGMTLVPAVTELILAELLYLQYENADKPITMYINSTGTSKVRACVVRVRVRVGVSPASLAAWRALPSPALSVKADISPPTTAATSGGERRRRARRRREAASVCGAIDGRVYLEPPAFSIHTRL